MYKCIYKYCFCKLIISFSLVQSSPTPSYPKGMVASSTGDPSYVEILFKTQPKQLVSSKPHSCFALLFPSNSIQPWPSSCGLLLLFRHEQWILLLHICVTSWALYKILHIMLVAVLLRGSVGAGLEVSWLMCLYSKCPTMSSAHDSLISWGRNGDNTGFRLRWSLRRFDDIKPEVCHYPLNDIYYYFFILI